MDFVKSCSRTGSLFKASYHIYCGYKIIHGTMRDIKLARNYNSSLRDTTNKNLLRNSWSIFHHGSEGTI